MSLLHYYRAPGLTQAQTNGLLEMARGGISKAIKSIDTETCFNIHAGGPLHGADERALTWLLSETFAPANFSASSFLEGTVLEVGPRMSFSTAWSTNAVSICRACGLNSIKRIERSRRYRVVGLEPQDELGFLALVHDRMTECVYGAPLTTFDTDAVQTPVFSVPVLQHGRKALEDLNLEMGLAFDDWDINYYLELFRDRMQRNPTNVECFDIAQSNSEHSRHWFFRGRLVIDGQEQSDDLMTVVQQPWAKRPGRSVIAFSDNSSAIRGYTIETLVPARVGKPSPMVPARLEHHLVLTAETHNFPSGVAPFPGAETGTGGRIRDVHATGRGGLVVGGTVGYCVGNLNIPGFELPWEDRTFHYPDNLASPLEIEIEASNGASDYGNKFGEPVITGFTRSVGLRLPTGERREWLKPIMFSGGIGQLDGRHVHKGTPEVDMWVVKIGGPAYRIGMGGGAASSMVQGDNAAELDFNAVQRGDAEMEQKVNRVIRACVELGEQNPIVSIHDQGAGGSCNVLKEIVDPAGARISLGEFPVGDATLSALEIWGAEYQENDALLLRREHAHLFRDLCAREKVPVAFVGVVTGNGRIVVQDDVTGETPVDLELEVILGKMPQKTFFLERAKLPTAPLTLPQGLEVREALKRVLRLLSVGSKRFLTTKVDRSVTGLIAQQQCTGPLQLTMADVAVIAQSHFGCTGGATAIGEQPLKGLIDPAAMARTSVGEALTNLVWAQISSLEDVRCSANWMWAAKLPGEGAALWDAAVAMRDVMLELGIAVDGGKDSLSMAARAKAPAGGDETVKAPGALVISAYAPCPDVTKTVTPQLRLPVNGRLLFVDLAGGKHRLGGSALAQVFGQVGDVTPDLDEPKMLVRAFATVQQLISEEKIASGHDVSDGGLLTTILEMGFAGNLGIDVQLDAHSDPLAVCFAEELGLVIEVAKEQEAAVVQAFVAANVPCANIGSTRGDTRVCIRVGSEILIEDDVRDLRDLWEETSFELDRLQADPDCVAAEQSGLRKRIGMPLSVTFTPEPTLPAILSATTKAKVAILREEGSNGDREMTSAFYAAGLEPWDVSMTDLAAGNIELSKFRGLVAVGGFSYADVLDSAKGWAGVIRFHDRLRDQFRTFYEREDTFSLGVCNGCQLLSLLGWVPWSGIADTDQPRFIKNSSGRFESRFLSVRVEPSPAILLDGMEGATLGVWVAHGEGQAFFPNHNVLETVLKEQLAPLRYVDDEGAVTEVYPFNPNGSPHGITALCSRDGRHLAMMPHPERAFLKWQWAHMPADLKAKLQVSPWLTMFQNAQRWCCD